MNLTSVASVGKIMLHTVSRPGHVGDELAVIFTEFHGLYETATGVVNFLSDLAIIPAVDDATSIREEVENVCERDSLLSESLGEDDYFSFKF